MTLPKYPHDERQARREESKASDVSDFVPVTFAALIQCQSWNC
ncbi:hypothetical protein [Methylobacterium sp. Leaf123]|nr:hypothetical protein [Methylobacterium sp. Leaf123]